MSETRINLADGKYTYVNDGKGNQSALRYGEPWRDLTGDNLVYWMACRIVELEEQVGAAYDEGERDGRLLERVERQKQALFEPGGAFYRPDGEEC